MKRQVEQIDAHTHSDADDDNCDSDHDGNINGSSSNKKRKSLGRLISVFSKDLCFNICEYLDSQFVLSVARLISVDWWHASELLDYSLEFVEITASNDEGKEYLESIFESQVLKDRLKCLTFSRCCLGDGIEVFRELKESNTDISLFPNLTSLDLSSNHLSDENICEFCGLIDEKFMCNLIELNLEFNSSIENLYPIANNEILRKNMKTIKLNGIRDPCKAISRMESLTCLQMKHCNIEEGSFKQLLQNENMKNLSKLYISDVCDVSIMEELANCQHISNIVELITHSCYVDMSGNYFKHPKFSNLKILEFEGATVINIDQLHQLSKLETLAMPDSGLTDLEIQILCGGEFGQTLKRLDISYNEKLTDHSIDLITSSFTKLSSLLLYGVDNLSIESTKYITNRLNNLTELELAGRDQSMSYQYFNCSNMKNLKILKLFSHQMGDIGLGTLIKSPFLSNLEHLWLRHCNIANEFSILLASKESQLKKLRVLDLTENPDLVFSDTSLGKEWIQDEEEEEEEDMTIKYIIRRNIPSLERLHSN